MSAALRLAIVVSHPIQYYVPLYGRLARRHDLAIKVFFTWHAGEFAVYDHGFNASIAWDVPLTEGYDFELVKNVARRPGTRHCFGLRNPTLVDRVMSWNPDFVHITGWAWRSHVLAMRELKRRRVPTLFRGDSHLLDSGLSGPHGWLKRALLRRVYSWPAAFLCVGTANRAYYEAFDVEADRLYSCPHSIDVGRFGNRAEDFEKDAAQWRGEIGIDERCRVMLFAGKFERKKRPVELMQAVLNSADPGLVLVLVGGGELEDEIRSIASSHPKRFRVLPFQNQKRMPVVYRLGDLFVLPSAYGETWGLAVNEALACGRPVLVSDRVGCAADVVDDFCVRVFPWNDMSAMMRAAAEIAADDGNREAMRRAAVARAWTFDIARTEEALLSCLARMRDQ